MTDPLYTALMMEAIDEVDVTFGGFFSPSGDFILAAQTIVGLEDNLDIISSVGNFYIIGINFIYYVLHTFTIGNIIAINFNNFIT